jgi:site-specific recombinase XerD
MSQSQRSRPRGRPGHNVGQRFSPVVLRPDEVKAIMAATNRGATGARNRAAIALMYRSGLRVGEALALRPRHVDLERNLVRVEDGKGGVDRTVAIDDGALRHIEAWMTRRRKLKINGNAPLLCQLDGSPWSPQAVREALRYAARKAGIDPERRVHPHALRHSLAAELAREGVPMNAVQAQLGHKSLATTSRYLAHVAPEELVAVAKPRTWAT